MREHKKDIKDYSLLEMERNEELRIHDADFHTEKTKSSMTLEEKNLVHNEIDLKMQELEDTGLTRMEILYNVEKGISLADDPVFQYLKGNRIAREMLIKATEVFTADAVIERALHQDMDPDPSMSTMHKYHKSIRDDFDPKMHYNQKFKNNYPLVNEESYIYGQEYMEDVMESMPGKDIKYQQKTDWKMKRKFDELKWEQEKPPTYINKPLTRDRARQKFVREVDMSEFNWKNSAFWIQFLTKNGKIKNKFQTRLTDSAQARLQVVVKQARNMGMLPYVGLVRPTDKLSLRSFYEDLEEYNKKSIDPLTGKLYYTTGQSDLGKRFEKPKGIHTITEKHEKVNKDLQIDQIPVLLNKEQLQWCEAQGYVLQNKKETNRISMSEDKQSQRVDQTSDEYLGGELAYKSISQAVEDSSTLDDLPSLFINEKAHMHVEKPQK